MKEKEAKVVHKDYLTIYVNGKAIAVTSTRTITQSDLEFVDKMETMESAYWKNYIFGLYSITPQKLDEYNKPSLETQLEQAIESENYEEAARIRDLIKKTV